MNAKRESDSARSSYFQHMAFSGPKLPVMKVSFAILGCGVGYQKQVG